MKRPQLLEKAGIHPRDRSAYRSGITDYETFLAANQKRVNQILNKFLWCTIVFGPLMMLAIRLGIFHSVTYSTCIVVTLLDLALCCVHYVLIQRGDNTRRAAVIAFLAIDILLILMNSAHIGIYITWFLVPLISLMFCDFRIFWTAVALNYAMMTLSVWLVSPYYAGLRVDFDRAFQYFAGRMGGFSIETVMMVVAGYGLCRISTSHYRELIQTIHDIDAQKAKEKQLIAISMTDELTGLDNRRSYDADIAEYRDRAIDENLVVFSVDVNELKEANDTKGHMAGDELLTAAAECLTGVIGPIGKVYRTGGDEFMAIARTDAPQEIIDQISRISSQWRGAHGGKLSLSVGCAAHGEHPEMDYHALEILADQRMYQAKKRYYSQAGNDRRRQTPD